MASSKPTHPRKRAALAAAGRALGPLSAALVAAALSACGSDDDDGAGAAGPSPFLELGAVLSLSGTGRAVGVAEQAGIRAAERHVNALGGVLGRPIRVTIVDDGSDTNTTYGAMVDLLGRTLPIVLGPTGSDGAAAVTDIAAQQRAVIISSSATALVETAQTGGSNFFFRLAPSDSVQGRALSLFARSPIQENSSAERCPTAAVIYSEDLYGKPIAEQFTAAYRRASRQVLFTKAVSTYLQVDGTYDAVAATVADSGAQCQFIITKPEVAAAYLRVFQQVKAAKPTRDWTNFLTVGGDALYSETFLNQSRENPSQPDSPSVAEGVCIVAPDATPGGAAYNSFRQIYQAQRPGETPPPFSANAFDAVVLASLAIEQAGGDLSAAALRDALVQLSSAGRTYDASALVDAVQDIRRGVRINYTSASGTTGVSANGEVVSDFIVSPVVSGQFQDSPLKRFTASELQ